MPPVAREGLEDDGVMSLDADVDVDVDVVNEQKDEVDDDNDVDWIASIRFQLILTRFLGGPIGGICCVARARNASLIRCGCVVTMFFHPTVSMTSVA